MHYILRNKLYTFFSSEVKQSHYRPVQSLRVPGGWGSQISRQSAHEGGKVVSPTHRPLLPPINTPGTNFCQRLNRTQGHGGLCQWKITMTPLGLEPATFRLVAQCLHQLSHPDSNPATMEYEGKASSWARWPAGKASDCIQGLPVPIPAGGPANMTVVRRDFLRLSRQLPQIYACFHSVSCILSTKSLQSGLLIM